MKNVNNVIGFILVIMMEDVKFVLIMKQIILMIHVGAMMAIH